MGEVTGRTPSPDPRAVGAHDCPRCGEPYSLDGCGCKAGRTPSCRHCDEPLRKGDLYWTHAHGLYRCQQKVTYGHNAAHPDVPCESLGPINRCACVTTPARTTSSDGGPADA